MKRLLLILALLTGYAAAQGGNTVMIIFPGAPSGSCSPIALGKNAATGEMYDCLSSAWHLIGGTGTALTGSGTANTVTKWSAASVLTNSGITDDGTTVATAEIVNFTSGPLGIGTSTPSALGGFSTTDDPFGTVKSAFAIQLGPTTSATTNAAATLTLEPADGVTTGQNFNTLNVGMGTDATQTKNFGTLKGLFIQTFPQTSGTVTSLIGLDIANQATNTNTITNLLGIRVQSDTAAGSANITTNNAIQITRTGAVSNPVSPTTIGTDAGLQVNGPATQANLTMTHHYGIFIHGSHTGGTGNADGWSIFDDTAANKTQLGILSTLGTITTPSQFISTVATGTAPLVVSSTTNVANLNASSLNGLTAVTIPIFASCSGTIGTVSGQVNVLNPSIGTGTGSGCNQAIASEVEMPTGVICTAKNLSVKAGAVGLNAGSGVVTLFKNGVASALTCTLGTGTSCTDSTHTVSLVATDTWSVAVQSNASNDTTAGVKAVFQCQL